MICRKQPKFLERAEIQINNVLEIRLASNLWRRIKSIARQRRRTYSTISRYCVLLLARKCNLHWTPRMQRAVERVKDTMKITENQHRHMMCLYGEDEMLIRLAAMRLGITLTAFARLAIELFLQQLAMEKRSLRSVSRWDLTMQAIRLVEKIQIRAQNALFWPTQRLLSCQSFDPSSYW